MPSEDEIFIHPHTATLHFDERMYERFGFVVSTDIKNTFIKMIDECDDDVELISDANFPKNAFRVKYAYQTYIVIMNVIDKCLITVWSEKPKHKKTKHKGVSRKIDKDKLRKKKEWLTRKNEASEDE